MHEFSRFHSPHFALHELADGALAAIPPICGSASCNAGLLDLGGQVVVFDAFFTVPAARDLRLCAETVFDQPPHIVINSHYHEDHTWGNQVFASEARILATSRTRELIATAGAEELQWHRANAAQRLENLRAEYARTDDEQQRREIALWIGEYSGIVETLPQLSVTLPGVTFSGRLELHGSTRTAELIAFENAHTGSDTILYLRRDGIVFMSDLLFVHCHPYLADGNPLQLLKALREISEMSATCFVPGHGALGSSDDVRLMIEYVEGCLKTARTLSEQEGNLEDHITALGIPETYNQWQAAKFYQSNIRFLCQWLSSSRTPKESAQ